MRRISPLITTTLWLVGTNSAFAMGLPEVIHSTTPVAIPKPAPVPQPVPTPSPHPISIPKIVTAHPPVTKAVTTSPNSPREKDWGVTVSLNIPHPVFLELEHRFTPKWSMGVGVGGIYLPFKLNGASATAMIGAMDVRARWHPFRGSFFLGTAFGVQQINMEANATIPVQVTGATNVPINTTLTAGILVAYLTPHLGWLWIWKSGFVLGFDLGLQLPVFASTTFGGGTNDPASNASISAAQQTSDYKDLEAQVKSFGNSAGSFPLPYLTILRLGWMF